jgi:hypothetical protein
MKKIWAKLNLGLGFTPAKGAGLAVEFDIAIVFSNV